MTRSRRLNSQPESSPVLVEALDLDAQGITRLLDENGQPGKVVFIRGALPTEEVTYTLTRTSKCSFTILASESPISAMRCPLRTVSPSLTRRLRL